MVSSGSGVTFKLHLPVILNICDHSVRAKSHLPSSTHGAGNGIDMTVAADPPRVYGCVIGIQRGRTVDIYNGFEICNPVTQLLDGAFLNEQQKRYKGIYPNFDVLGWYSTGSDVAKSDMAIHRSLMNINKSPVYVLLNPRAHKDPHVTIYESEVRVKDGIPHEIREHIFVRASYTIETEKAKMISGDHVAHLNPSNGDTSATVDHKTKLQMYAHKRKVSQPVYDTIIVRSKFGKAFESTVSIDGDCFTSEIFPKKKDAEKDAARLALCHLSPKMKDEGCHLIHEAAEPSSAAGKETEVLGTKEEELNEKDEDFKEKEEKRKEDETQVESSSGGEKKKESPELSELRNDVKNLMAQMIELKDSLRTMQSSLGNYLNQVEHTLHSMKSYDLLEANQDPSMTPPSSKKRKEG
ncbi:COP9 signalosome complex subunit 6b-like [Syzygium oleosum]|uniref:COP9 signalosome complex subunit 6b-like n=1 Tax=Syzygium oleosum TaxID=219896 RepID=UPI0011D1C9F7|nr:COP9 signalosome complex subunit 6b-like [Syzygium oleosum]